MRARASSEHQAAVERRLALLRAELAGETRLAAVPERDGGPDAPPSGAQVLPGPEAWWEEHTRLAGPRPVGGGAADPSDPGEVVEVGDVGDAPVPATPAPEGDPTLLPVPGRHAARRRERARPGAVLRRASAELLPEAVRGRVALGPGGLATVALLVATALALSCWFLVRARPTAVDLTSGSSAAAPSAGAGTSDTEVAVGAPLPASTDGAVPPAGVADASAPSVGAGAATVTVDVEGRVRHPGIAVLPTGARVVDALEAAGGARPGVDLAPLNLARVLVDGEQLRVGIRAATAVAPPGSAAAPPSAGGAPAGPTTLTDLNTATETQLEALPEVGPVTARSILDYRDQHGGFASVDELLDVDGIGEATLEKLRPWVTV